MLTANTRKYLTDQEAESLGLPLNKKQKGKNRARYKISDEEFENVVAIRNACKEQKIGLENVSSGWLKTKTASLRFKNPLFKDVSEVDKIKNFKDVIDELKKDLPKEGKIKIPKIKNKNLCNQYTLTDFHLGMMAWGEESGDDWDLKIAEETLIKFFKVAISKSPDANECIFAEIGDFLHWDGMEAVTPTSKHVLDADTRFTKLVRVSIRLTRRILKMLLKKYRKVTLIMAEGNHNPASSIWMREVFSSFYEDEDRLVIDTNPDPYYCTTFGDVCLFYHHGHKKKMDSLDSVFVSKFKKEYGGSKYVYGHTGHLHHNRVLESNLMTIEQHRTLAAKDAHASRGGYRSGRDAKVITYHKDYGEVGRQTININMLR